MGGRSTAAVPVELDQWTGAHFEKEEGQQVGLVEYDDIFAHADRHRTEFCFRIDRKILPSGETWLGFMPIHRFNAIDGGCMRPPSKKA